jgi:hypothetical protein
MSKAAASAAPAPTQVSKAKTAAAAKTTTKRHRSRIMQVPISQMKVPPALVTQRPFIQSHGDRMASELDLDKLGLPVMNFRDSVYWILDGQHRIYAMKKNSFLEYSLDCEVYDGLTDAEMARIFLGRDSRKAINPLAKFHVACTAELPREVAIRRVVEQNGLHIAQKAEDNCIRAIQSVAKVYDRSGEDVLAQTLRVIKNAYGGDPGSFHQSIIVGIGLLFHRYQTKASERGLADALRNESHGFIGLLRRAEAQRERTGNDKAQCVAAAVVETFNKRATRAQKLPSWWKVDGD